METQLRLSIDTRGPFAGAIPFGDSGSYERFAGRVSFAIDPADPANQGIVDLNLAPRNSSGLVEFSTEFYLLKPIDLSKGNRRLVYDVVNRGDKRILQFFNDAQYSSQPASAEHAGNGYLMRRGYSILWSGWQGDILPGDGRMTIDVPVAGSADGEVSGPVRSEFIVNEPGVVALPLSGNTYTLSYETVSLDTSTATLSQREYPDDPRELVPTDRWQFASVMPGGEPVPSSHHCYVKDGFRPGWIYELVYTSKNPPVLGLGFAGVRDLVSFLLNDRADIDGIPNPLRQDGPGIEHAYAWGRSQSGRFLREFVYRGFNQDTRGRKVFSGVWAHVAGAGRVALNHRFAQPGRFPRQHFDHLFPSDQFPFAYSITTDALTGKTGGILKHPQTDPVIFHSQTGSEYWERHGSLVHTDAHGNDQEQPEGVRVFLFASSQHRAYPNEGPQQGPHQYPSNPLNTSALFRALLDALDAWVTNGTPPPKSRIPTRRDGTLVPPETVHSGFPGIPGVTCPSQANRLFVQDFGQEFDRGITAKEPPDEDMSREYTVLVPSVDSDGNDVPGIRTPNVEVPLATFTGWNFRPKGAAEKSLAGVIGSYLPFAPAAEERRASGDPRPSIKERYPTQADYVREIGAAARRLVEQRLLLEEDADRYVEMAKAEQVWQHQA